MWFGGGTKMFMNFKLHIFVAFLVRLLMTMYGLYHDASVVKRNLGEPKYTDVDYSVFTDAAAYTFKVN
jgi:hypothetical protein